LSDQATLKLGPFLSTALTLAKHGMTSEDKDRLSSSCARKPALMDQQRMPQISDFSSDINSVTDTLLLALDQVKASINITPFVRGNNAALRAMKEWQEPGPCKANSDFLDRPEHIHDRFLLTLRHGLSTIHSSCSAKCSFIWRLIQEHANSIPANNPSSRLEDSVHDASQGCDRLGASQLHASLHDIRCSATLLLVNTGRLLD
jgi:hypothetical protein